MPLVAHPAGNYCFLPGIAPYSCGVVSTPGFEIVHVMLRNPVDYQSGFNLIRQHLEREQRPVAALCAIELRSPCPFTFPGFAAFNAIYAKVLENWGLFVDGVNPVARTNVAPEVTPPSAPALYGFSYTMPTVQSSSPTFVVAGAGELPEGVLAAESIIAVGDVSLAGIRTKAQYVMDLMEQRLRGLGADWPLVTDVDVYTIHPIDSFLGELILKRMRPADTHGIHWHYTRPPIEGIEFEMDLRGIRTEIRLD